MATLDELSTALVNADKAGDTGAARMLAAEITKMRAPQGVAANAADFVKSMPRGAVSEVSRSGVGAMMSDPGFMMGQATGQPSPYGDQSPSQAAEAVTQGVERNITGPLPEPQGRAGKFGAAIAGGLANPMTYMGPGGMGLKVGGSVLSSAASEGAGQATEGTPFEGPSRVVAALAGGATAGKIAGPTIPKAEIPTAKQLLAIGDAGYTVARQSGLELHPAASSAIGTMIERELTGPKHGFSGGVDGTAPKTMAAIGKLQNPPEGTVAITASNLDTIRKSLQNVAEETQPSMGGAVKPTPDAAAATVALKRFNEFTENLDNLPPGAVLAGDPKAYVRATKEANGNWGAGRRTEDFDARLTKAENATDRQVAGSLDSQIKSKAGQMLDNPAKLRGLNQAERDQLQLINSGGPVSNTMRQLGRGGAGVIPIVAQLAAAPFVAGVAGPLGLVAQALLAGGLYGARKGSEAITKSRAGKLAEMLAERSPEYERRKAALPPPDNSAQQAAIIRALIGAN
jgi:hypothetical protein